MDYENTDISKTLKKHMGSNSSKGKIVLAVCGCSVFVFCGAMGGVSLLNWKVKNSK